MLVAQGNLAWKWLGDYVLELILCLLAFASYVGPQVF